MKHNIKRSYATLPCRYPNILNNKIFSKSKENNDTPNKNGNWPTW